MELKNQKHALNKWFVLKCHKFNLNNGFPSFAKSIQSPHNFNYLSHRKHPKAYRLLLRTLIYQEVEIQFQKS